MNSAASEPDGTGDGAFGAGGADGGATRPSLGRGRALVAVPVAAPSSSVFAGLGRSHGYVAAGVAVVMGLGFVAGTQVFASKPQVATIPQAVAKAAPSPDPTLDALSRVQGEVRSLRASLDGLRASAENTRQDETIRGLKRSVDTLKGDLEGVKTASTAAVGQLGAKIDKLDRDPGPKLAEIATRLDKMDRDPSAKLADVSARLDRVERQVSSADVTGSVPPQNAATAQLRTPMPPQRTVQSSPPAPVAAVPPARPDTAKPELAKADAVAKADAPARPDPATKAEPARQEAAARPATVEGWMLRDVYGGVALLEGRAGGLREVAPGEYVAGVGEIRSIERRGRGWVVVTSRGIIQADNR